MRKNFITIFSSLGFLVLVLLFLFYYRIGINFGEAAVRTVEGVKSAQEDWSSRGVNPIDSMENQLMQIVDTSSLSKE